MSCWSKYKGNYASVFIPAVERQLIMALKNNVAQLKMFDIVILGTLNSCLVRLTKKSKCYKPVDIGRKLNVHKTFRRRPERVLNVLCTFNLRPVSTGKPHHP